MNIDTSPEEPNILEIQSSMVPWSIGQVHEWCTVLTLLVKPYALRKPMRAPRRNLPASHEQRNPA